MSGRDTPCRLSTLWNDGWGAGELAERVLEVAPAVVVVLDQQGRIAMANHFFEELTGLDRSAVCGMSWVENFVPARDRSRVRAMLDTTTSDAPIRDNSNPIVAREGAERVIDWCIRTLDTGAGNPHAIVCVGLDVTDRLQNRAALEHAQATLERRIAERSAELVFSNDRLQAEIEHRTKAEKALRRERERLEEAQRLAHIGHWEWEIETNALSWSDEVYRIFGIEPQSVPVTYPSFLERVYESDRSGVESAVESALRNRNAYGVDHRIVRPDGSLKWVHEQASTTFDSSGQAIRMLGTVQDITDRKLHETELTRSHARFRAHFEGVPLPTYVWQVEGPELFLVGCNNAAHEYSYGSIESIIGLSAHELYGDEPSILADLERVAGEKQGTRRRTSYTMRSTGAERIFEVFYVFVPPDQVAVYTWDITEQVQIEEELRRSVKEKDLLLREVHHRVKNNLQVVSSLLYLQARAAGDQATARQFEVCRDRIRSMAIIHETLYRGDDLSSLSFAQHLVVLVETLRGSLAVDSERLRLKTEVEELPLPFDAAVPCGLIVNELITNAVKYAFPASASGSITVHLSCPEPGLISLSVEDDGVGLPEGFDPSASRGLGFHLITALADQIGATLVIERGKGTRVTTTFPCQV